MKHLAQVFGIAGLAFLLLLAAPSRANAEICGGAFTDEQAMQHYECCLNYADATYYMAVGLGDDVMDAIAWRSYAFNQCMKHPTEE